MPHPTLTSASVLLLLAVGFTGPLAAQGGLQARLLPPVREVAEHEPVRQYLARTGMLQNTANAVNAFLLLPRPVAVTATECGVANASYRPQQHEIVLCYEMVRDIISRFRARGLDAETMEVAVGGATAFVLYHEVGHALIGELQLPVTGREEDVADQFAAFLLGHHFPVQAIWAAQFWMERAGPGAGDQWIVNRSSFADEHGLDAQRFFNVICWTYGISPADRAELLTFLTPERAQRCPREAAQMVEGWDRMLAPHQRGIGDQGLE